MERRTVLVTAVAFVGSFTGCMGSRDDGSGGDGSPTTPSPSPARTPTESPARTSSPPASEGITATSFEIVENVCGTGRNEASVQRSSDLVTVRGTISGRNSCYTAALERATYDADMSELTVAVRSFSDATEGEACGQCLVDIDYRARVSYDAPEPETVTVRHNGETL